MCACIPGLRSPVGCIPPRVQRPPGAAGQPERPGTVYLDSLIMVAGVWRERCWSKATEIVPNRVENSTCKSKVIVCILAFPAVRGGRRRPGVEELEAGQQFAGLRGSHPLRSLDALRRLVSQWLSGPWMKQPRDAILPQRKLLQCEKGNPGFLWSRRRAAGRGERSEDEAHFPRECSTFCFGESSGYHLGRCPLPRVLPQATKSHSPSCSEGQPRFRAASPSRLSGFVREGQCLLG